MQTLPYLETNMSDFDLKALKKSFCPGGTLSAKAAQSTKDLATRLPAIFNNDQRPW